MELLSFNVGDTADSGPVVGDDLDGGLIIGDNRDGSFVTDGASSISDGATRPPAGNPDEVEVCIAGTCSSDVDRCPDDPAKQWPGICGCGVDDGADQDGDGIPDCIDLCPGEPDVLANGTCGCSAAEGDSDGDGTPNCLDYCPSDPDKTGPGTCGCNVSDRDTDGDGMPDCADACADDANKLEPGLCGCGLEDSSLDSDGDGIPDCTDTCGGLDDSQYVPDDSCGVGYCHTHNTPSSCVDGVETACEPGTPLSDSDTTCDGIDDDCDGEVDEDYVPTPTANTCGEGACTQNARLHCENGELVERCEAGTNAPDDATCDGVDDDCDGVTDEDYLPTATSCGQGACASTGTLSCVNGAEVDSCTPGPAAPNDATCDGIDEDCDGVPDDDFQSVPTSCGMGACGRAGMLLCIDGALVDSCWPGTPAANDATCDGVDDDCDGRTDEDYQPTATSCGVGACASTGTRSCVNGVEVDSCTPGTAAADDTTCDGVDDDCDGRTDEGYVPNDTCGVGYCLDTNTPSRCVGGVEQACIPGTKLSDDDASADGVDDDCDGQVDEDACIQRTETFNYNTSAHTLDLGGCRTLEVRLWGGGGAAGEAGGYWSLGSVSGGAGGAGGYTEGTLTVASGSTVQLYVGQGGQGCGSSVGSNPNTTYRGGGGGTSSGASGSNGAGYGTVTGGNGGSGGGSGGRGGYGGGGGGAGSKPGYGNHGEAGAGGAATVLVVGGSVAAYAGGGGGGGGVGSSIATSGHSGGAGGPGCDGNGSSGSTGIGGSGGGGGGGGDCGGTGTTTQKGSGRTPPQASALPSGNPAPAYGGAPVQSGCAKGGNGYATVTFKP